MAFDFKKEYKEFYLPKNTPSVVTVPPMNFVAVRGHGDPNEEDGEYKRAIGMLYGIAFTIKMSKKGDHQIDGYFDYVVPPLEGFWWQDGVKGIDYAHKETFNWISVIRLPDFVTKEEFDWAIAEAEQKRKPTFPRSSFSPMTRDCACSVCTLARMTTSRRPSRSCTNLWNTKGMFSILRASGFTMRSISATQGA